MVHGIAPAGARRVTEMRAAERGDAALGLHLAEAAIVGREHQLDADREDDALYGRYDRLSALVGKTKRIDIALGTGCSCRVGAEEFRHVEASREILAGGTEHADPEPLLLVEPGQGIRQLCHHLRAEGVLLGHIVDRDLQNAVEPLIDDPPFATARHLEASLRADPVSGSALSPAFLYRSRSRFCIIFAIQMDDDHHS